MLKPAILIVLLSLLPFCLSAQAPKRTSDLPKISLQLHSVKEQVQRDFKQTLTQISALGFDGVEFAGRYGPYEDDPKGLKQFLSSIGLEASGAHIPLNNLQGEKGERALLFFKQLGVELVIIPYDKRANDPDNIAPLSEELTETFHRARRMGLTLGYHNHALEFEPFEETTFWDFIAQNTPQEFALQLDVGWAKFANKDPVDYVKRYPNRTLTTHYKIRSYQGKPAAVPAQTQVILGQDNYDWQSLIKANIEYGGTQWIVIEQEEYPEPLSPMQSVKASMIGLQAVLNNMNDN
ncbi:sugar phosphate isomerase/epimerase family protein [Glaciecola sp. SC05]|uniref:sugar phosphate isomerase/epimerase family protein n=1 Tax=Glaciecola sp. SC05 TaxID=1987355 RepID=UPI00352834CD